MNRRDIASAFAAISGRAQGGAKRRDEESIVHGDSRPRHPGRLVRETGQKAALRLGPGGEPKSGIQLCRPDSQAAAR
jgi:hypothetical protein